MLASAGETELRRLAGVVDERLRSLTAPGRQVSSQALVLAALALAHDLEEERSLRRRQEQRSQEMLKTLLSRIDAALESDDRAESDARPSELAETAPGES